MNSIDELTPYHRAALAQALAADSWRKPRHAEHITGEPLAFHVESHQGFGARYLVRLDANLNADRTEANGHCSCIDFETRCMPNFLDAGHEIVDHPGATATERTRCKHVRQALRELGRVITMQMITNELNQ